GQISEQRGQKNSGVRKIRARQSATRTAATTTAGRTAPRLLFRDTDHCRPGVGDAVQSEPVTDGLACGAEPTGPRGGRPLTARRPVPFREVPTVRNPVTLASGASTGGKGPSSPGTR